MAAVDLREEAPARTVALAPVPEARSIHVVDFTGPAAVGALPEMVISRHGGVDGLISNAGITQPFVGIAELDHPARQRVLNANSWDSFHMVKAFLRTCCSGRKGTSPMPPAWAASCPDAHHRHEHEVDGPV